MTKEEAYDEISEYLSAWFHKASKWGSLDTPYSEMEHLEYLIDELARGDVKLK